MIGKKTGFHWHWHQLRHTYASRFLEIGGSLESLRLILGHSSTKMTEVYAHMTDRAVFSEVSRLGIVTKKCNQVPCETVSKSGKVAAFNK